MMKKTKFWKCTECSVVLEEVSGCGKGPECVPQCCGMPMQEITAKMTDGAVEKHLPVYTELENGSRVSVGSVPHPMTPEHHIEWIELVAADGHVCRKYLKDNDSPEAVFACRPEAGTVMREYCNLHGLWESVIS